MHFNDGLRGGGAHFLFDGQAELNVLTSGIDLLTGDKPIEAGVFGQGAAVARQKYVHDAETNQTLPALLPDVTVGIGDFKGFLKGVGGAVSIHHDVRGHLIHRGKGAQPPPVTAVAPLAVILPHRMTADGKGQKKASNDANEVGMDAHQTVPIFSQHHRPVVIQHDDQGVQQDEGQTPHHLLADTGGDFAINQGQKHQGDEKEADIKSALNDVQDADAAV